MRYINVISETPNLKMSPSVLSKVDYKDLTMGIEFEFAFNRELYIEAVNETYTDVNNNNRSSLLQELNDDQNIYSIYDFSLTYSLDYKYDYPTYEEIIDFKTNNDEKFSEINKWYNEFINTNNKENLIIDLLNKDWFPSYLKGRIRVYAHLIKNLSYKNIDNLIIEIDYIFKYELMVDKLYYTDGEDISGEISEKYIKYNGKILNLRSIKPSVKNILTLINIDEDTLDEYIRDFLNNKIELSLDSNTTPGEILYNIFEEHMHIDLYNHYHSEPKRDRWVIEPDGSVSPDGVEFVSPPQPVIDSLNDMKFVFEKINEHKYFYTNSTTGLHINIGTFRDISKIDLLKMMLFLGEEHVLKLFSREHNEYAKTILEKLYFNSIGKEYYNILDKSNDFVMRYASERYQSVNFRNLLDKGYLEIRILGGAYLNKQKEIITQINRFISVINIACDPNLYRETYMKKLYTFKNSTRNVVKRITNTLENILSDDEYYTLIDNIFPRNRLLLDEHNFIEFLSSIDINKKILPIILKIIKNPVTYQIDNSPDYYTLSDNEINDNKYLKYYLTLLKKYKQK